MIYSTNSKEELLDFVYLPSFARFILNNHLEDYVQRHMDISRQLRMPALQFFNHLSKAEILAYTTRSSRQFLEYLAVNKAGEILSKTISNWNRNRLQYVEKDKIALDDIFLISFLRKRIFLDLLQLYTNDVDTSFNIIGEIDRFFMVHDRETSQTYVQLLKARIEEDSYFKEKLTITSPGFYYLFDIENDCQLQSSDKLFEYLGYEKSAYMVNPQFFRSLIHPEDIKPADQYIEKLKLAKDGEVLFFEYRLRDKGGEYKWMRNYESVYYRNNHGKPVHSIGVAFDITKEHFTTEELIKREEELLEAQELSNIGSYVWNIKKDTTFMTPQALLIMGLKIGDPITQFESNIHPSDIAAVRQAFFLAVKGIQDFDIEYRCRVNNEERIVWGRGKAILENDEPVLVKGTVMDVTDRHHIIQKLKRSEELYQQAQSMNKLGNWTWEIQNNRLTWSDELYRIYGLAPQSGQLSFERFIGFVHPDDRENRLKKLQEQMLDTELRDYYFRIIAADGTEKFLYGQSQVLADEKGLPHKMIGTCQDVTRQKELENSLYQKTIQLERSNASLEEFAYITSHDLKEPLRKISIFGEKLLLQDDQLFKYETKLHVGKIIESAARMQGMVDDILSLSRITFDRSFQNLNLETLLQEVVQTFDYKIEELNINLSFEALPPAVVNETQIRQLFQNLIANSIKFRKEGVVPQIDITHNYLSKDEARQLGLAPLKKYLRIIFKDNGIGFENEFSDKIFTIFQRLHSKGRFEGTGVGLAICKKIVENHQGLISAKGEVDMGAQFTIIIPSEG